jgi:hypothetical protein
VAEHDDIAIAIGGVESSANGRVRIQTSKKL